MLWLSVLRIVDMHTNVDYACDWGHVKVIRECALKVDPARKSLSGSRACISSMPDLMQDQLFFHSYISTRVCCILWICERECYAFLNLRAKYQSRVDQTAGNSVHFKKSSVFVHRTCKIYPSPFVSFCLASCPGYWSSGPWQAVPGCGSEEEGGYKHCETTLLFSWCPAGAISTRWEFAWCAFQE